MDVQREDQPRPYDSITFTWLGRRRISKEVRHSRGCNCCWIIAPEEAIEALYRIEYPDKPRIRLSVQEVIDCFRVKYPEVKVGPIDSKGCYTSKFKSCFTYIMEQEGVVEEHIYPFNAQIGACRSHEIKSARRFTIEGYKKLVRDDEATILEAIGKQPIVAIMDVYMDLLALKKEVYEGPEDKKGECYAHGMLIVGYGIENNIPYYLVKSSWGTKWGIGGFGKIARSNFRAFRYPIGPVKIRK